MYLIQTHFAQNQSLYRTFLFYWNSPQKMFEKNHQKSLPSQRNIFFVNKYWKKMSPQGQSSFSQKNTVHRRRGVWRILMNYIQPNAGQTTHSIYTLIQDGAQYVPLKCRKARREFYWTKKTGGDWGILMFLGASRVLFCCCCESQMGYLKKRKAMGVVHFACIIMFNVKHPLFNVHLQLFTRF